MAIIYVRENKKLYEIDEKGEKQLVRSVDSSTRAFLRFTNKTSRAVDVWWRDFRGDRHHYICLGPGAFSDINSFVTHPWEFTDTTTDENYVIDNRIIFRAPKKIGGMMYRTNWNVTVQVRSLKFAAMLRLAERLPRSECVSQLGLPKTLEEEVAKFVRTVRVEPDPEGS